jgi:hypothetical protein
MKEKPQGKSPSAIGGSAHRLVRPSNDLALPDAKLSNPSGVATFWQIDNRGSELAEMDDYPGAMAVFIDALKREGVRFNEADFKDGDVTHLNKYITIFRGEAAEFLHRACESIEGGSPAQEMPQDASLILGGSDFGLRKESDATENAVIHKHWPNIV